MNAEDLWGKAGSPDVSIPIENIYNRVADAMVKLALMYDRGL